MFIFTIKPGSHFCVKGFFQNNSSRTLNETVIQNEHLKPIVNTEKVWSIVIVPGTLLSAFKTSLMYAHTSCPLILYFSPKREGYCFILILIDKEIKALISAVLRTTQWKFTMTVTQMMGHSQESFKTV